jgi:hypothetical protein
MLKQIVKAILIAAPLFAAVNAQAAPAMKHVKMMQMTLEDGSKLDLEVVKMHGKMMVLVPEDRMPDVFHQQMLKYSH